MSRVLRSFAVMLAAPCVAQELAPDLALHALSVNEERRMAFVAAWRSAGTEARDRAREHLRRQLRFGAASVFAIAPGVRAQATRMLAGENGAAPLVVDALDLRVVPGALEADEAGELVVHVRAVWSPPWETRVAHADLRLVWWGPGKIELRGEPLRVERGHLSAGELVFSVVVPRGPSGLWHLAPELEFDGVTVQGHPVPVESVARLFERLDERPVPNGSPLEQLLHFGVRSAGRVRLGDWLQAEIDLGGRLVRRAVADFDPAAVQSAAPVDDRQAGATLVVLTRRPVEWELDDWSSLVERGARVVVLDVAGRNPRAPKVETLLTALRASGSEGEIVLVVRGDTLGSVGRLLGGDAQPFDRVVHVTAMRPAGEPSRIVRLPLLSVVCLADEDRALIEGTNPDHIWTTRAAPPDIVASELPGLVAGWLGLERASGQAEGAADGSRDRDDSDGRGESGGGRR